MTGSLGRWLAPPVKPTTLGRVRMAVVGYCIVWTIIRWRYWLDQAQLPSRRRDPVGVLAIPDWTPTPNVISLLVVACVSLGVVSLWASIWRWSGPVFAALFLVLTTHGNSWGQILHTENLAAMSVVVLALGPAGSGPGGAGPNGDNPDLRYGWPLRVLSVVTVSTYVVAGIAKFRFGGLSWVDGNSLRNLVAHDNLRKELLGDPSSPLAPRIIGWSWLFSIAAVGTVAVELLSPLALIGKRAAVTWSVLAWLFHVGVLALMAVLFPYPLLGFSFAPLVLGWGAAGQNT